MQADTISTRPTARDEARQLTWLVHLAVGAGFGILLTKAEVISWFRIQEMFRFQSFHMYGVLGSAVAVGMISVYLMRRFEARSLTGAPVSLAPKEMAKVRYPVGGAIFGLGWGLTGACPGPLFALVGSGLTVMLMTFAGALVGTWLYGNLRDRLPH